MDLNERYCGNAINLNSELTENDYLEMDDHLIQDDRYLYNYGYHKHVYDKIRKRVLSFLPKVPNDPKFGAYTFNSKACKRAINRYVERIFIDTITSSAGNDLTHMTTNIRYDYSNYDTIEILLIKDSHVANCVCSIGDIMKKHLDKSLRYYRDYGLEILKRLYPDIPTYRVGNIRVYTSNIVFWDNHDNRALTFTLYFIESHKRNLSKVLKDLPSSIAKFKFNVIMRDLVWLPKYWLGTFPGGYEFQKLQYDFEDYVSCIASH